ncbi:MAG: phage integrase SAM-like domain-containing protein [Bacteroidaceae bacterium]|nr:phage integrase SAM-like domain-containing protein [Bacteroidaceae bacterium]
MRTYFLRTSKQKGTAKLYTQVKSCRNNFHFFLNTGIDVDVERWHKSFCDLSLYAKNGGRAAELLAQSADKAIDDVLDRLYFTKEDIQEAVSAVVHREEREAKELAAKIEREEAERREERERIAKAREDADVRAYLESLIAGMKDGSIRIKGKGRNKGERYTANTIKMWNNLAGIIERYYKVEPFTWDSIGERFASRFRAWMENEGYMAKSINKYIGQFVALINRAYDEGKHTNQAAANSFMKPAVDEAQKAAEIYLTADELNALYQMPLTGEKALVRDIFIVGCCTCQRVSDYSQLKRENFTTTARGAKVVKLRQTKTRNFVIIPILDDKLTAIMEKYDYNLPQLPSSFDVILNRYIKEICKELAESVPSLNDELPTILTMKEREKEDRGEVTFKRDEAGRVVKPRYELVTSHTARRTGITNLYLTGKFDIYQMMHVSGHKEAKTFREYIKLSGDEMAEQIAEKMGNDNLF